MKKIENIIYPFDKAETLISYSLPDTASDITIVLGHGKYNDMTQPLLAYLANTLPRENVNVVRFNYPFVDGANKFRKRKKCLDVYHQVLDDVRSECPGTFLFIGGKSYSARISEHCRADDIKGYIFIGYPLNTARVKIKFPVKHLSTLEKPMMFIQGAEDKYSDRGRLELLMGALDPYARLMLVPDADHSLELVHEDKRSQKDVNKEIADVLLWFASDVIEKEMKKN